MRLPPQPLPDRAPQGIRSRQLGFYDINFRHPAHGAEPQKIRRIFEQAECGWPMEQADLFSDIMETDGHLRSVIESRTLSVAGKGWNILPGDDSAQSEAAADLLRAALQPTNLSDAIGMVLSARYYGYSGTEIVWEERDGDAVPVFFVTVPHRRFRFDQFDNPLLLNEEALFEGEPLEPGRWMFATNSGPSHCVAARSGLMRPATWYSCFKRWAWRDAVLYSERYGLPLIIGKYGSQATADDKSALQKCVEDLGEAGQAIMSEETEIEIREAQQSGDFSQIHRTIIKEANSEISKLIAGATLMTEPGTSGSFAMARVQENRAFDFVVSDAAFVARVFMQSVAIPFLKYNAFDQAAPPIISIPVVREFAPSERMKLYTEAHGMGVDLDKAQVRDDFQFRPPPEGDEDRTLEGASDAGETATTIVSQ